MARGADGAFHLTLAPATNNTDARDPSLVLVGGDPVILVEPGAADRTRPAAPACRRLLGRAGSPGAARDPPLEEAWVAPTG